MSDEQAATAQLLRTFAPLDGMKRENLAALAKKVSVRTLSAGRTLFSQGDTDKRTVWLVSGILEINDGIKNLAVLRVPAPASQALGKLAARAMQLQCTVQDEQVWFSDATQTVDVNGPAARHAADWLAKPGARNAPGTPRPRPGEDTRRRR